MEHTFEEKAYIANNRPFIELVGIKAEATIIESECLTEYNFYDESLRGKVNPELYGYNGIAVTLKFKNLGNSEKPVLIGFNKFAQFVGSDDWDMNMIFDTPSYMTEANHCDDDTYEKTYLFVCQPCNTNDDCDFEKFEATIKNKEMLVLFNFVCSNGDVEERFESIGTTTFNGNMNDTKLFSKDRRSYHIVSK